MHVGMPDAETCLRVMEHLVPRLPVVLALSANSPWFEGERDRSAVDARRDPLPAAATRSAACRSSRGPTGSASSTSYSGVVTGYGGIHWDIRRIRSSERSRCACPINPTDVERTGAFAALIHALARWALEQAPPNPAAGNRRRPAELLGRFVLLSACRADPPEGAGEAVRATDLYAELVERTGSCPRCATWTAGPLPAVEGEAVPSVELAPVAGGAPWAGPSGERAQEPA